MNYARTEDYDYLTVFNFKVVNTYYEAIYADLAPGPGGQLYHHTSLRRRRLC